MRFMRNIVRNYPLSWLLVIGIWVLCLIPIPETPLDDVTLIDKWTHIVFYLVLTLVVRYEDYRTCHSTALGRSLMLAWLAPALMGGLIEIVQATCTGGRRSGDWLDFLADAVGATIGWLIGMLLVRYRAKG